MSNTIGFPESGGNAPSSSPGRPDVTPSSSPWTSPPTQLTPNSSSDDSKEHHERGNDTENLSVDAKAHYGHDELAEQSSSHSEGQKDYYTEDEKDDHGDVHSRPFSRSYTPDEERIVVKKFDRRLVLFMALLYMLSFLDRSSKYPIPPPPPHLADTQYKHRQRQNRRPRTRSSSHVLSIRMAPYSLLHHLHHLRMDDPDVPPRSAPHIHLHLHILLGATSLSPIPRNIILVPCYT